MSNARPFAEEPPAWLPGRTRTWSVKAFAARIVVAGLTLFLVSYFAWGCQRWGIPERGRQVEVAPTAAPIRYWTCPMHPQVRRAQKGNCPICFMDLVPVNEPAPEGQR